MRRDPLPALLGCGVILLVIALVAAITAGLALLLQWLLAEFGVVENPKFWPCFGAVFLAEAIFGGGSRS